jgi:predicted metal-dependent TIM-barrel fold hydrolase
MLVDLHLHADGIRAEDLATLAYFGVKAAVTCARDTGGGGTADLLRHWDGLVHTETQRLKLAGIRPLVALALHPARIPWHGVDELLHLLPHYFDDPRVVALGEIGLHEGSVREEEVFSRQLELAARLQKPVIVHTPGREKLQRTRRMLALIRESPLLPAQALIDHVCAETFPLVRGMGCWAGLTLQPDLFDARSAAAVIAKQGPEGIVLTSDIGEGATDLLALPKAADALKAAGLSAELRDTLLWRGPLQFLGQKSL